MIPLIFYDIPSKLEGNYWSPSTAKSRFILGCKGLPFRVEWVEYCDIAPRMKEIGIRQNKLVDGRDGYTLPVLNDPNTGALITDSWEIAEYLEKTYPEKPIFLRTAFKFPMLRSTEIMNERGAEYFIATREEGFKEKFSEFSPEGPKRDEHWANLERMFNTSKEWYDEEKGKWLMGDVLSYADIIMASRLFWFERVLHDDEWEKIANWHGGRWAKLLVDVEKECREV